MPKLLAVDQKSRVLMLEDLGPAQDCTDLYSGGELGVSDCNALVGYLDALHERFRDPKLRPVFANRAMRALNHEHIFALPLRVNNGLDLDKITPGLDDAASELKNDAAYCRRAAELGELYSSDGVCLVHGDFFPGSWIRTSAGLRVIDPEFCFFGVPAFDLGVFLAHMYLAKQRDGDHRCGPQRRGGGGSRLCRRGDYAEADRSGATSGSLRHRGETPFAGPLA